MGAAIYVKKNAAILSALYVAAAFTAEISVQSAVTAAGAAFVFFFAAQIFIKLNKPFSKTAALFCVFLGGTPIFLFVGLPAEAIYAAAAIAVSVAAACAALAALGAVYIRKAGTLSALTVDEKAAFVIYAAAAASGLYSVNLGGSPLFFFFSAGIIMTACLCNAPTGAFIAAAVFGAGAALQGGDMRPLTLLTCLAAASSALRPLTKYAGAAAIVGCYFLLTMTPIGAFPLNAADAAAVIAGTLAPLAFDRKLSAAVLSALGRESDKSRLSERGIVNNTRIIMTRKLSAVGAAFSETSVLLKGLATDKQSETARLMLSEQFGGAAKIFYDLSKETSAGLSFDDDAERRVYQSLAAENIVCRAAAVYGAEQSARVLIIINENDVQNPSLSRAVSNAVGQRLTVSSADIPYRGYAAIEYRAANKFDIVYGEAHVSRGAVSGDVKCALKIGGDKFIAVLSDGMGRGPRAKRASENAVNLVENFYRAGLSGQTAPSLINRVLCDVFDDVFATLDMCVIDLKNGLTDFIKMGADDAYVLGRDGAEVIKSSALPLGAVKDATATLIGKQLRAGDFVVLVSDGVADAFPEGGLISLLNSIKTKNPQTLADALIKQAVSYGANDDSSALVIRIYEKN
ncbi:MAG: SpoIIE family protein phosphatase [Clostridiales bacterium]|nr:SpoIIE family protein phosphatase [Clostridiales bacterium]